MIVSETERHRFPCRSCGETLYTRALVCPYCGAADPAGEPPEPSFEPLMPRRVVVDVPAATAEAAEPSPAAARLWPEGAAPAEGPAPATPTAAASAPAQAASSGAASSDAASPEAAPVGDAPAEAGPVDLEPVVWRSATAARAEPTTDAPPAAAEAAPAGATIPEDLEPVVWRSAAAAQAEPLPPRTPAAGEAPTAGAEPDALLAADAAPTEAPAATDGGTDAAADGAAPPAADGRTVRPDGKPTADRFDELLAVSAAEAGDNEGEDAGALPDDLVHGDIEPPRRASAEARLDIAPRRDGRDEAETSARDLVLVPTRGGRELGPVRRRTPRILAGSLLILLFIAIGAAGALFWRQLGPVVVAEETAREVVVGRAWAPLELAGTVPAGGWAISASGPFRIRVDGAVYTVAGPVPFALPLSGGPVEVRAVGDEVKLTVSGR